MKNTAQPNTLFAQKMKKAVAEQRNKKQTNGVKNINTYGRESTDHLNFSAISRFPMVRLLAPDNVQAFINPALGKFMMLEGLDYYLHSLDEAARYFERRVKPGSMREPSAVRTRKAILAHQIYTHLMSLSEQDREWLYGRLELPFLSYSENRMGFRIEEKGREDYLRLVRDVLLYASKGEMLKLLQKLSKGKAKNIYRQLAPKAVVGEDLKIYTDAEYAEMQKKKKEADGEAAKSQPTMGRGMTKSIVYYDGPSVHWFDLYRDDWQPAVTPGVKAMLLGSHDMRLDFEANAAIWSFAVTHVVVLLQNTPVVLEVAGNSDKGVTFVKPHLMTTRLPVSHLAEIVLDCEKESKFVVDMQIGFSSSRQATYLEWTCSKEAIVNYSSDDILKPGQKLEVVGIGVKVAENKASEPEVVEEASA